MVLVVFLIDQGYKLKLVILLFFQKSQRHFNSRQTCMLSERVRFAFVVPSSHFLLGPSSAWILYMWSA